MVQMSYSQTTLIKWAEKAFSIHIHLDLSRRTNILIHVEIYKILHQWGKVSFKTFRPNLFEYIQGIYHAHYYPDHLVSKQHTPQLPEEHTYESDINIGCISSTAFHPAIVVEGMETGKKSSNVAERNPIKTGIFWWPLTIGWLGELFS